jgi:hypothetical protein
LILKNLHDGVGIAAPDGFGEVGDPGSEAVDAVEDDDAVADRRSRWRVRSSD